MPTKKLRAIKLQWKRIVPALCAAAVLAVGIEGCNLSTERLPVGEPTEVPAGDDWIDLFAGEAAGQWENVSDDSEGIFSIEDGIFEIPGGDASRYIAYMGEPFGDFEMHIEYKIGAGGNSGVFVRSSPDDPVYAGMEVQVLGDAGSPPSTHGSGALYDIATPMFNVSRAAGEWNSYDIRFEGSLLTVHMNGWKVLDLDVAQMTMPIGKFDTPIAELPREGHIILQDHESAVTYRNLRVRKL